MAKMDELRRRAAGNVAESMGAGLDSLGAAPPAFAMQATPARLQGVARSKDVAHIRLDRIGPDPDQPREEFDEESLARLAESLKTRGQLQPIRVRWDEARSLYIIICGERRWRAARLAGLETIACVIVEGTLDPSELLAIQLVENALREDLRPIEQARAYRQLMERNGWSTRQVARELSIAQPQVVRALALLELPEPIRDQVEQGTLAPATAYEISKLADVQEQQEVATKVVSEGLTRSETTRLVQSVPRQAHPRKLKGKPTARGAKLTRREFKSPLAKVTVELRKGSGLAAMVEALEDVLRSARSELGGGEKSAA